MASKNVLTRRVLFEKNNQAQVNLIIYSMEGNSTGFEDGFIVAEEYGLNPIAFCEKPFDNGKEMGPVLFSILMGVIKGDVKHLFLPSGARFFKKQLMNCFFFHYLQKKSVMVYNRNGLVKSRKRELELLPYFEEFGFMEELLLGNPQPV